MTAARILKNKATQTITIASGATIGEAVDVLSRNNIGALVVSDDGKTISGILSERDVIHGLKERGASLLDCAVGDCMTQEVHTCTPFGDDAQPAGPHDRAEIASFAGCGRYRATPRHRQYRRRGENPARRSDG